MTSMSIRLATADDVDAVMEMIRDAIAAMKSAGIEQWDEIYPDRATILADLAARALWVATTASDRIVGMVVVNDMQNVEYADVPWTMPATRIGVVHRVVVDPAHQRQGIAVQLMCFAEQLALGIGYDVVRLDAFVHNPTALRLYDRLGYHDAGAVTLRKGVFRCFEKRMIKSPSP